MTHANNVRTLYAPSGWTTRNGIARLLSSYCIPTPPDFRRFSHVGGQVAKQLLANMPTLALTDRQNNAPHIAEFLRIGSEYPDEIELGGYLVGPQRWDERVSIDMVTIKPGPAHCPIEPFLCRPHYAWEATRKIFGFSSTGCDPDEVELLDLERGVNGGWWMWWD